MGLFRIKISFHLQLHYVQMESMKDLADAYKCKTLRMHTNVKCKTCKTLQMHTNVLSVNDKIYNQLAA